MNRRPEARDVDRLLLENVRWQAVLDTARDAIVSIDGQGRIILFNRCAEEMFGYPASEVLGRNVSVLMPEPDAAAHDAYLRRYARTGEKRAIGRIRSVQGLRASGEVFPVELSVSETSLGDVTCYTAILRDISQVRSLQANLEREHHFGELLVSTARLLVLVLDTSGRVAECNDFLAELVGEPAEAIIGRDWAADYLPAHAQQPFADLLERSGASEVAETSMVEHAVLDRHGAQHWVEWRASRELEPQARTGGRLLLVGQDVTRRRRDQQTIAAYRELVQERERRGDFAALLAQLVHDLGNPLAGLSAQVQLIRSATRRDASAPLSSIAESAELISNEIRRLTTQVRELLTFSRQQQRLEMRRIDARAFLDRIAGLWRPVAQARGVALEVEVEPGIDAFHGDEEKLRRVVENLVKNALDAMLGGDDAGPPAGSHVTLRLERLEPDGVELRVCDDGPGLAPGLQVFRLFETTKSAGSGLGLALSRQLVQAHGGEMRYEPVAPHGACFIISLPEALGVHSLDRAPPPAEPR